jgi:nucleoside-diphosphate-sugar epimerase
MEVFDEDGRRSGAHVVAVTGIAGSLGQRLLPVLDADTRVERIIGLDVRDPARRARKLVFHRVDVIGADLVPFLRGADTIVHLASVQGPLPDERLFTRVNLDGTRRMLRAASGAGVRAFIRPSSTAVYGAWANNPVPLTESAPLRPSPGYLPATVDAECERLLAAWAREQQGRRAVRLRIAPVVGAEVRSVLAATALGAPPVHVRGAAPPLQVVHAGDAASALARAALDPLDGAYNVAADGWLTSEDAAAVRGRVRGPALAPELAGRLLAVTWSTGVGDAPPQVFPYLVHPWVVSNERLAATGWVAAHTNESALARAAAAAGGRGTAPWVVVGTVGVAGAVAAGAAGALGAGWWLRRRSRGARSTRPTRA